MAKKKLTARIGTSNIVIPGNKTTFPAAFKNKSRLNYYSHLFNSLEVNSSFYKIPMQNTFARWAADTTPQFDFTVKLFKEITHAKDLKYKHGDIVRFLQAAAGLGDKKSCLLIQFPGKITMDYFNQVEDILQTIQQQDPENEWKKAIEFRHNSWYTGETNELLDEYNASLVVHDIPKSKNIEPNKKAPFVYVRYHGPKGDYRDGYGNSFLKDQAAKMKAWLKAGKQVYAYFNNSLGSAFEDAVTLQGMMKT